jgi:glycerophosphoryl diester phosphodiesterase
MWNRFWQTTREVSTLCRPTLTSAVAFSLAFRALNFVVLAPAAVSIMSLCLRFWGRASIGNFDLAAFFLSPIGVIALPVVGCVLLASLYFELSGLVRLLANPRLHWWQAFRGSTRLFPRLIALGLLQVTFFLALAVPFLAGIGLTYLRLWHGKDLNGLIILKPPEFWWGIAIAGTIVAAYGIIALPLFLHQLFAIPILILESPDSGFAALRLSSNRSRGTVWHSARALAVWFVVRSLVAAVVLGAVYAMLSAILPRSSQSIATVIIVMESVFLLQFIASTLVGVLASISFVAVVLVLYRRLDGSIFVPVTSPGPNIKRQTAPISWQFASALLIVVCIGIVAVTSLWAARDLTFDDPLEITAHRAGAIAAPENTVAALKQAILDRADWAEIDVQLTADEKIVVMHDIDLARVGGGNVRVDAASLAEIQVLDVGASFGERFAGERIPTFQQMLAAAGDRIRLNVELKPHGKDDAVNLTRRVIDELRQARMLSRCRICSQSYESLQLAKQLEPQLEVGYIEGAGIGDPTRLDVDFLMVKSSLATPQFVARARQHGKQIHPWTVNDPELVAPLVDAGVANLITDNPALIRSRLDQIRALTIPQRLLLRTANAISR